MSILGRQVSNGVMSALVVAMVAAGGLLPAWSAWSGGSREIVLVARGMTFYLDGEPTPNPVIEVASGETVRIVLRNEDRGVKHDFALPALGASSRLLNWDEMDGMTVTMPEHAGVYEYVCRPHLAMMKGTVRVR